MKKYVAYNPSTFIFKGFYNENRKDLPETIWEVDPSTYMQDKGEHTHFKPDIGFYTNQEYLDELEEQNNRNWRDSQLIKTDKYMLSDYPITALQKLEVQNYRQELRDYPETWVRPTTPEWM